MAGPAGAAGAGADGPKAVAAGGPWGESHDAAPSWSAFFSGDRCRRAVLVETLGAHLEACSGWDVCDGVARAESPVAEAVFGLLAGWRTEEIGEALEELRAAGGSGSFGAGRGGAGQRTPEWPGAQVYETHVCMK